MIIKDSFCLKREVTWEVRLTPDEVINELSTLEPAYECVHTDLGNEISFSLSKGKFSKGARNAFLRTCRGRIAKTPGGSEVVVSLEMRPAILIPTLIWIVFGFFVSINLFAESISSPSMSAGQWAQNFLQAFFFPILGVLGIGGGRLIAARAEAELLATIDQRFRGSE